MGEAKSLEMIVRLLVQADSSYAAEAYYLVREAVSYAQTRQDVHRHLTAGELVEALLEYAEKEYGLLAGRVLSEWGLTAPADIGRIVYKLIEAGVLSASPDDSPEDFQILTGWLKEPAAPSGTAEPLPIIA
ncbi:MAG: hypothetical protein J6S73_06540 [Lentisphaeria bacterium]|nr:hypothetical protein [Lentisphaeria bacterium]